MKLNLIGKLQIFSAKLLFDLFLSNYEYQPRFALSQSLVHSIPISRVGKSGVAAAKRAARKLRNRKK